MLTIWKDWLTDEVIKGLGLTERQSIAVAWVKKHGRITNANYQRLAGTNRKTSARDLDALVVKSVFRRVGEKRGSHYVLGEKK